MWTPSEDGNDRLCKRHCKPEDIITTPIAGGERFQLKKGTVPSLFPFTVPGVQEKSRERQTNALQAKKDSVVEEEETRRKEKEETEDTEPPDVGQPDVPDFLIEMEIDEVDEEPMEVDPAQTEKYKSTACQTSVVGEKKLCPNPVVGNMNVESLSAQQILYYTGFGAYDHFKYVFGCLGPAAENLKYKSPLTAQNEFLLTLMKLRQNKDDEELGYFFSLPRKIVGRIFHTWINFLFYQLKELDLWLPREVIRQHLPTEFQKKYPETRVIIDGTEVGIDKPSRPKDQSVTWSSYKNKNTIKVIVGISPKGVITYVSDAYGGSASDRQIVERSELLKKPLTERGDSIMADRGFHVQDLFCLHGVRINTPTYMRGISQLNPEAVERDRVVSSQRVHIERIIGLAKTYKILCSNLNHAYVPLGGRILFVCFALSNFKPCIVPS